MKTLDEKALRKPGFEGGRGVILSDGQEWFFPLPVVELIPDRLPSGRIGFVSTTQFGLEYDRMIDELSVSETKADEAAALFDIAIFLLGQNYEIADEDLPLILRYQVEGDDGPGEAMEGVRSVATGIGPKPSPAGLDSGQS